jgi:hypothetical protein
VKTNIGDRSELRNHGRQFGQKWSNLPLVALSPARTKRGIGNGDFEHGFDRVLTKHVN